MHLELTPVQFTNILAPNPEERLKNSVEILTDIQHQAFMYALREGQPSANDGKVFPSRKMQEALAYGIHARGSICDSELAERLERIAQAHTFTR